MGYYSIELNSIANTRFEVVSYISGSNRLPKKSSAKSVTGLNYEGDFSSITHIDCDIAALKSLPRRSHFLMNNLSIIFQMTKIVGTFDLYQNVPNLGIKTAYVVKYTG